MSNITRSICLVILTTSQSLVSMGNKCTLPTLPELLAAPDRLTKCLQELPKENLEEWYHQTKTYAQTLTASSQEIDSQLLQAEAFCERARGILLSCQALDIQTDQEKEKKEVAIKEAQDAVNEVDKLFQEIEQCLIINRDELDSTKKFLTFLEAELNRRKPTPQITPPVLAAPRALHKKIGAVCIIAGIVTGTLYYVKKSNTAEKNNNPQRTPA